MALSSVAFAQDESAPGATGEPEIIVMAARRSENLQNVPMSVDVATGEQLQKFTMLDVKDVQQLAPGLQLSNSSGRNNTATLRGVTFDPDQGTSPSVDLYLNEVPVDAQTAFTAMYDLEQIEVLRGPQGALRGRTAPAGAITIRTRRPDLNEVNGYAQATMTDRAGYNVQGAVSLPIIPGELAVRAAVLVDGNRVNQVYNANRGERSRGRTESARLSLAWEPTSDLKINLSYQYLTSDVRRNQQVIGTGNAPALGDPTRSGPAATVSDYIAVSEGGRRFRNDSHFLTLSADWDLGPVTLSLIGGHQYSKLVQDYDLDAGNAIPGYINNATVKAPYLVDTVELRVSSNNSGLWNWTLGAFYNKHTGANSITQKADTFFGNFPIGYGLYLPIDSVIDVPINDRTMSIAASSRFEFTDKLKLEVAARLSDEKNVQTAAATVVSPGFAGIPGFPIPARPAFGPLTTSLVPANLATGQATSLTGGATLSYMFSPQATGYIAYGRSFRLGSAGVGVPSNITTDLIRTQNETSDAVEVGLKMSAFDRKVTANIAAYYQKYNGYIVRTPYIYYDFGARNAYGVAVGSPDGVVDGVFPSGFNYNGDATVKGIEATVAARPTPNWDLSVSAAYTHGRFDNAHLPCNDFNGDGTPDAAGTPKITGTGNVSYCVTDGRMAELPDFNLSANTEFRLPVGTVEPFIGALVTYRPGYYYWQTAYHYQSNTLVNLYLGVRGPDRRWELKGFVKNLLDQKHVVNVLGPAKTPTANPAVAYDSGYQLVSATDPREFGATLSFNF